MRRRTRIRGLDRAYAAAAAFALAACAGGASADSHEAHAAPAPTAYQRVTAPPGARAYIISPQDGARVSSPVLVQFGLSGMGVAPAGVANPATGHHHLIIDAPTPDVGAPIPNDANHRHFGGGQTEASIELAPGRHTLQLVLGDALHVPHDPPIASAVVTVTVE